MTAASNMGPICDREASADAGIERYTVYTGLGCSLHSDT